MKDQIFYCQDCGYTVEAEEGYRFENPNAAAAWAQQEREQHDCKREVQSEEQVRRWHRSNNVSPSVSFPLNSIEQD